MIMLGKPKFANHLWEAQGKNKNLSIYVYTMDSL